MRQGWRIPDRGRTRRSALRGRRAVDRPRAREAEETKVSSVNKVLKQDPRLIVLKLSQNLRNQVGRRKGVTPEVLPLKGECVQGPSFRISYPRKKSRETKKERCHKEIDL